MMLAKIIFFTAVTAATLAVILLALVSPSAYKKSESKSRPLLALSLYVHEHHPLRPDNYPHQLQATSTTQPNNGAIFIFHHTLTEGPSNTSRVIGRAQGFIIPIDRFAHSAFNIICLTLETPEYSGSLSVDSRQINHGGFQEELAVVGGTGSFAFARGLAMFVHTDHGTPSTADAMYHLRLKLSFPG